jgi:probable HAF family extracellular repeat protein
MGGYDVIDLGGLGSKTNYSEALAVNNSGLVVGDTIVDDSFRATAWINHVPQDLGTLGGPMSQATAVNDSGQIVGFTSVLAPNQPEGWQVRAFIWQNGVMTDLGSLDNGDYSLAAEG